MNLDSFNVYDTNDKHEKSTDNGEDQNNKRKFFDFIDSLHLDPSSTEDLKDLLGSQNNYNPYKAKSTSNTSPKGQYKSSGANQTGANGNYQNPNLTSEQQIAKVAGFVIEKLVKYYSNK